MPTNNSLLLVLTAEVRGGSLGFVAPSTGDVSLELTVVGGR